MYRRRRGRRGWLLLSEEDGSVKSGQVRRGQVISDAAGKGDTETTD